MQGHENEGLLPENGGDERGRLGVEGGIIGENEVTEARNEVDAKEGNFEVKDGFGGEPEAINNSDSESEADLESRIETKEESEDQTGIRDETEGEVENSEKEGEIDDRKREVEVVEHNIQTGSPERIEPQISGGKPSQTKKNNKKGLIAVLAVACLVVIGAGIGVWIWKGETEEEEPKEEAEVVYLGMMPEEKNEKKQEVLVTSNMMGEKINDVAYQNGGLAFDETGKDVYNYDIIRENIDEYIDGIEDEVEKNLAMASAISLLSGIGDTSGAETMVGSFSVGVTSEKERYCYYQAMRDFYLAKGDKGEATKYTNLAQEVLAGMEEE